MQKNKIIIIGIIGIFSFIFLLGGLIVYGFISEQNDVYKNTILVYDEEGIPASDSALFILDGWDKIPRLNDLVRVLSEENGGQINKVVIYNEDGFSFIKTVVIGDYNNLEIYGQYSQDSGWLTVRPETLEKTIKKSLDKKILEKPITTEFVSPE